MLHDILMILIGIVIGAFIGFFIARKFTKKYMEQNPPINEEMLKHCDANGKKTKSETSKSNDEINAKIYVRIVAILLFLYYNTNKYVDC